MKIKNLLCGLGASLIALSASLAARADDDNYRHSPEGYKGLRISYVPNSLAQSVIKDGPWTLHESGHFKHDASGIVPTTAGPPYSGSGVPYAAYCNAAGALAVNHGFSLMQPYYFPFVRRRGDILEGFFDYRPRNEQEAAVEAISTDWGASWIFKGEALALNPYCPWDPTDPDNLNVNVNGVKTAYGSSSANAADNGLGHPVVLNINGVQRIYQLNRANNHIDSDQLVVHTLRPSPEGSLSKLPDFGYVSPLASGGYPKLESTATATSGLVNPDAILGAAPTGTTTAVLYVEKTLNGDTSFPAAQQCSNTPAFALTNLINGKPRKPNHDVTAVRVATTTDGVNFTDVGVASGLSDPTTVALNGIRYLGSGSILPLADGRYGMFFGAGNCLDNDSDGFHFIGYAETTNRVTRPSDLLSWRVVNGLDNPILSTDTVTDPSGPRPYPLNPPIVNVSGADALSAAQVAPFAPVAGGYNSNFFSGRVYDPQALYTDSQTVTIVFAGYDTPQPSNNLGDYRSIGRFQVQFPRYYIAAPF
ncbi:hypothetical protein RZS28_06540 [Methylocapsa polymorpha]|uniref:Uncharacterized protein n=1 Tax=Methylocapsa polymorpha TaxID=3080828 RepID=A0ABZ0HUI7_9HYPH|nr:hypothetical protein RZS28_06540 [Methylocapsa sp. RX1]